MIVYLYIDDDNIEDDDFDDRFQDGMQFSSNVARSGSTF